MAKKFKFRLERVREYKATIKQDKKRVLSIKNAAFREAEDQLALLIKRQRENEVRGNENNAAMLLRLAQMYAMRLKSEIVEQGLVVEKTRQEAELALQEYIQASKELEMLDTLKKKQEARYMEQVQKAEEDFLDELTVQRIGRKAQEA